LFEEILKQADEISKSVGMAAEAKEKEVKEEAQKSDQAESRDVAMAKFVSTEPSLDFSIEGNILSISYQNLKRCEVNVYFMDIELLFSTNPFIEETSDGSKFMCVAPNKRFVIDDLQASPIPSAPNTYTMQLPEYFHNANAYVEITAPESGVSRSQPFYSHSLAVQIFENYGQIKVDSKRSRAAVPQAYIKVYAKLHDGTTEFYKDGYTDLRGRFDYASISNSRLDDVSKFSILVSTDSLGAVVRQARPPAR